MSEKQIRISRRSALVALASIGVGSAAAGAGTFAAFNDTESDSGSLSTESVVLQEGTQVISFTSNKIAPGASGKSSVVLESTGTAGGRLDVAIPSVQNTDDASTEPEEDAENGTNEPLSEALEVKMWVEEASPSNGTEGAFDPSYDYGLKSDGTVAHGSGATLSFANVDQYPLDTTYQTMSFADSSPTDKEFFVKWRLPQETTNAFQRDSTTINFDLTLRST